MAVRGDEVLISDHHNDHVQVFRVDGTYVRRWGSRRDGSLKQPLGLAVTRTGHVLVGDIFGVKLFE